MSRTSSSIQPTLGLACLSFAVATSAEAVAQDRPSSLATQNNRPDPAAPTADAPMALPEVAVSGQAPSPYLTGQDQPAPRLPTAIRDTPQSISVVPRQVIDERAANTVREALRNVTGISLAAGEGGFSGDNLTLRGFPARNDFYLDGLRDIGQYNRDSFFLDSIEVLKGPSSILFGRGSTGGVINQTSRLPQARNFGSAEIQGWSPGGLRATSDVNVYVAGVAVRLDAMAQDLSVAGRSQVSNSRYGVAPSITLGLGTNTQFTLAYVHQEETNVPDFGVPYINGRPAPVSRRDYYGVNGLDNEHLVTDIATMRLQHRFSDEITVRDTFRYANYFRNIVATAPRVIGTVVNGRLNATVNGTTDLNSVLVNRQPQWRRGSTSVADNLTEAVLNFRTGPVKHSAILGMEFSGEWSNLTRYTVTDGNTQGTILSASVNPATLFRPDFNQYGSYNRSIGSISQVNAFTASFYAVDQASITDRIDLLGGIRFDHFDASTHQLAATYNANQQRTDDLPSYRAGIVYKPAENARVYFAYGTSFNPSAENLTVTGSNATAISQFALTAPEKNRTFEIGGNWTILDGLDLRGALFRIEKTNARTVDPVSGFYVLSGNQKVDGFEVSATGRVLPGWNIITGYTYLDANIVSSKVVGETGHIPLNVPRHTATLWTTYDLPQDVQIAGGISYIGTRYANNTDTLRVPSYARYDAAISWQPSEGPLRGVRLSLNAINLTDKKYYDGVYQGNVTFGAGRTFISTLAFRW